FDLPNQRRVSLIVYDIQGRRVRSLIEGELPAGHYALRWDGRNDARKPVSSGVYFCRMVADDFKKSLKLVLLK
ncbi:MAG: FlgD immunoglobulin-like domain containing protein, partial [Candidatus Latescibacterota bacterium]